MVFGIVLCRCLVVVVFGASAISKVRGLAAFREFAASIVAVGVTRPRVAQTAAALVVCGESAVCLALLTPFGGAAAYGLALLLVAVFSATIAYAIRHAPSARCRCFGAATAPFGYRHLVRNSLLGLVAAAGLLLEVSGSWQPTAPPVLGLSVLAGVAGAALVIRFDDLADLLA